LREQRRIEGLCRTARHAQCADVPGDVPHELGIRQSKIAQAPRNARAGMIRDDEKI